MAQKTETQLDRMEGMLGDLLDKVASIARVQDDLLAQVTQIGVDVEILTQAEDWDDAPEAAP